MVTGTDLLLCPCAQLCSFDPHHLQEAQLHPDPWEELPCPVTAHTYSSLVICKAEDIDRISAGSFIHIFSCGHERGWPTSPLRSKFTCLNQASVFQQEVCGSLPFSQVPSAVCHTGLGDIVSSWNPQCDLVRYMPLGRTVPDTGFTFVI